MDTDTVQTPAPADDNVTKRWAISVAILAVVLSVGFILTRDVGANADYICTHVVEENGPCTGGSWGPWTTVSSDTTGAGACNITTVEERVYTGTRTTQHILQYLNLRTACEQGYTQQQYGDAKGDSGFHGGQVFSQQVACQIQETRTTIGGDAGSACVPTTKTQVTNTDLGPVNNNAGFGSGTQVSSLEELNQFRASMINADITAQPRLVRSGQTSVISWQGREVTACTVQGENGDTWNGTSGERVSSPITEATTYTLECEAFNGTTVTGSVTVNIAPTFEET